MHGIVFKQLNEYVEAEWGDDAWERAMDEAGIEPKLYLPVTEYPDEEALRLLDGVTTVTGVDEDRLLVELGEHMAPALLDTFEAHVRDQWDALDLMERSGNEVFDVLRPENGSAEQVETHREGEDTVLLEYGADLELCGMAVGMLRGLAAERDEPVEVVEENCVEHGADRCEIRVTRT